MCGVNLQYFTSANGQGMNKTSSLPMPIDLLKGKFIKKVFTNQVGTSVMFLDEEGRVYSCGRNRSGMLAQSSIMSSGVKGIARVSGLSHEKVVHVSLGHSFSVFLCASGALYAAGMLSPPLSPNSMTGAHPLLQVKHLPEKVASVHVTGSISREMNIFLVTESGSLYTAGTNSRGECGVGHGDMVKQFVRVRGLEGLNNDHVIQVDASAGHVAAITSSGLLYAWGSGDGCGTQRWVPTLVPGLENTPIARLWCGPTGVLMQSTVGPLYGMCSSAPSLFFMEKALYPPSTIQAFEGVDISHLSLTSVSAFVVTRKNVSPFQSGLFVKEGAVSFFGTQRTLNAIVHRSSLDGCGYEDIADTINEKEEEKKGKGKGESESEKSQYVIRTFHDGSYQRDTKCDLNPDENHSVYYDPSSNITYVLSKTTGELRQYHNLALEDEGEVETTEAVATKKEKKDTTASNTKVDEKGDDESGREEKDKETASLSTSSPSSLSVQSSSADDEVDAFCPRHSTSILQHPWFQTPSSTSSTSLVNIVLSHLSLMEIQAPTQAKDEVTLTISELTSLCELSWKYTSPLLSSSTLSVADRTKYRFFALVLSRVLRIIPKVIKDAELTIEEPPVVPATLQVDGTLRQDEVVLSETAAMWLSVSSGDVVDIQSRDKASFGLSIRAVVSIQKTDDEASPSSSSSSSRDEVAHVHPDTLTHIGVANGALVVLSGGQQKTRADVVVLAPLSSSPGDESKHEAVFAEWIVPFSAEAAKLKEEEKEAKKQEAKKVNTDEVKPVKIKKKRTKKIKRHVVEADDDNDEVKEREQKEPFPSADNKEKESPDSDDGDETSERTAGPVRPQFESRVVSIGQVVRLSRPVSSGDSTASSEEQSFVVVGLQSLKPIKQGDDASSQDKTELEYAYVGKKDDKEDGAEDDKKEKDKKKEEEKQPHLEVASREKWGPTSKETPSVILQRGLQSLRGLLESIILATCDTAAAENSEKEKKSKGEPYAALVKEAVLECYRKTCVALHTNHFDRQQFLQRLLKACKDPSTATSGRRLLLQSMLTSLSADIDFSYLFFPPSDVSPNSRASRRLLGKEYGSAYIRRCKSYVDDYMLSTFNEGMPDDVWAPVMEVWRAMDLNGDGRVTEEEFQISMKAQAHQLIDRLDFNTLVQSNQGPSRDFDLIDLLNYAMRSEDAEPIPRPSWAWGSDVAEEKGADDTPDVRDKRSSGSGSGSVRRSKSGSSLLEESDVNGEDASNSPSASQVLLYHAMPVSASHLLESMLSFLDQPVVSALDSLSEDSTKSNGISVANMSQEDEALRNSILHSLLWLGNGIVKRYFKSVEKASGSNENDEVGQWERTHPSLACYCSIIFNSCIRLMIQIKEADDLLKKKRSVKEGSKTDDEEKKVEKDKSGETAIEPNTLLESTVQELLGRCTSLRVVLPFMVSQLSSNIGAITPFRESVAKLALSVLRTASDLSQRLPSSSSSSSSTSFSPSSSEKHLPVTVVESSHPYREATRDQFNVQFGDDVSFLLLQFDEKCCTSQEEDFLQLHTPLGPIFSRFSGPPRGQIEDSEVNWPPAAVLVPGNAVQFDFQTASDYAERKKPLLRYGFRCTVKGLNGQSSADFDWLRTVEAQVAYLSSVCAYSLIGSSNAPPSQFELSHQHILMAEPFVNGLDPHYLKQSDLADGEDVAEEKRLLSFDPVSVGERFLSDIIDSPLNISDVSRLGPAAILMTWLRCSTREIEPAQCLAYTGSARPTEATLSSGGEGLEKVNTLKAIPGLTSSITVAVMDEFGVPVIPSGQMSPPSVSLSFYPATVPSKSGCASFVSIEATKLDLKYPERMTQSFAISMDDGTVLVFGGYSPNHSEMTGVYRFDIFTKTFTFLCDMPNRSRGHHGGRLHDGRIYLVGLYPKDVFLLFDPITVEFEEVKAAALGIGWETASCVDSQGLVHTIGGMTANKSHKIFNPVTKEFTVGEPLPIGRFTHGVAIDGNDTIYVFGGSNSSTNVPMDTMVYLEVGSNEWQEGPKLPTTNCQFGFCQNEERVVIIGGSATFSNDSEPTYDSVWVFEFASRKWMVLEQKLPLTIRACASAMFGDTIYTFGGASKGQKTDTVLTIRSLEGLSSSGSSASKLAAGASKKKKGTADEELVMDIETNDNLDGTYTVSFRPIQSGRFYSEVLVNGYSIRTPDVLVDVQAPINTKCMLLGSKPNPLAIESEEPKKKQPVDLEKMERDAWVTSYNLRKRWMDTTEVVQQFGLCGQFTAHILPPKVSETEKKGDGSEEAGLKDQDEQGKDADNAEGKTKEAEPAAPTPQEHPVWVCDICMMENEGKMELCSACGGDRTDTAAILPSPSPTGSTNKTLDLLFGVTSTPSAEAKEAAAAAEDKKAKKKQRGVRGSICVRMSESVMERHKFKEGSFALASSLCFKHHVPVCIEKRPPAKSDEDALDEDVDSIDLPDTLAAALGLEPTATEDEGKASKVILWTNPFRGEGSRCTRFDEATRVVLSRIPSEKEKSEKEENKDKVGEAGKNDGEEKKGDEGEEKKLERCEANEEDILRALSSLQGPLFYNRVISVRTGHPVPSEEEDLSDSKTYNNVDYIVTSIHKHHQKLSCSVQTLIAEPPKDLTSLSLSIDQTGSHQYETVEGGFKLSSKPRFELTEKVKTCRPYEPEADSKDPAAVPDVVLPPRPDWLVRLCQVCVGKNVRLYAVAYRESKKVLDEAASWLLFDSDKYVADHPDEFTPEGDINKYWTCPKCTLKNEPLILACASCLEERPVWDEYVLPPYIHDEKHSFWSEGKPAEEKKADDGAKADGEEKKEEKPKKFTYSLNSKTDAKTASTFRLSVKDAPIPIEVVTVDRRPRSKPTLFSPAFHRVLTSTFASLLKHFHLIDEAVQCSTFLLDHMDLTGEDDDALEELASLSTPILTGLAKVWKASLSLKPYLHTLLTTALEAESKKGFAAAAKLKKKSAVEESDKKEERKERKESERKENVEEKKNDKSASTTTGADGDDGFTSSLPPPHSSLSSLAFGGERGESGLALEEDRFYECCKAALDRITVLLQLSEGVPDSLRGVSSGSSSSNGTSGGLPACGSSIPSSVRNQVRRITSSNIGVIERIGRRLSFPRNLPPPNSLSMERSSSEPHHDESSLSLPPPPSSSSSSSSSSASGKKRQKNGDGLSPPSSNSLPPAAAPSFIRAVSLPQAGGPSDRPALLRPSPSHSATHNDESNTWGGPGSSNGSGSSNGNGSGGGNGGFPKLSRALSSGADTSKDVIPLNRSISRVPHDFASIALTKTILKYIKSSQVPSSMRTALQARRPRALQRARGLAIIRDTLESTKSLSVQHDTVWVLSGALRKCTAFHRELKKREDLAGLQASIPESETHYMTWLHGCGPALTALITQAFRRVYSLISHLLRRAMEAGESDMLMVLLDAWKLDFQLQDQAFLHDCQIFPLIRRIMAMHPRHSLTPSASSNDLLKSSASSSSSSSSSSTSSSRSSSNGSSSHTHTNGDGKKGAEKEPSRVTISVAPMLVGGFKIEASSGSNRVDNMLDGTTETYWQSSENDDKADYQRVKKEHTLTLDLGAGRAAARDDEEDEKKEEKKDEGASLDDEKKGDASLQEVEKKLPIPAAAAKEEKKEEEKKEVEEKEVEKVVAKEDCIPFKEILWHVDGERDMDVCPSSVAVYGGMKKDNLELLGEFQIPLETQWYGFKAKELASKKLPLSPHGTLQVRYLRFNIINSHGEGFEARIRSFVILGRPEERKAALQSVKDGEKTIHTAALNVFRDLVRKCFFHTLQRASHLEEAVDLELNHTDPTAEVAALKLVVDPPPEDGAVNDDDAIENADEGEAKEKEEKKNEVEPSPKPDEGDVAAKEGKKDKDGDEEGKKDKKKEKGEGDEDEKEEKKDLTEEEKLQKELDAIDLAPPEVIRQESTDLQEQVVGLLFSEQGNHPRSELTDLQRLVCELIFSELHSEATRLIAAKQTLLLSPPESDGMLHHLELTSEEKVVREEEKARSDAYVYELVSMVAHLSVSSTGQKFIASPSFVDTLVLLLVPGTPRIQRSLLSTLRRVLPRMNPDSLTVEFRDYTDSKRDYTRIPNFFFYCIASSLSTKIRINEGSLKLSRDSRLGGWPSTIESGEALAIVQLMRYLHSHSKRWKGVIETAVEDALVGVTELQHSTIAEASHTTFWLSLGALSFVGGDRDGVDILASLSSRITIPGSVVFDASNGSCRCKVLNEDGSARVILVGDLSQSQGMGEFRAKKASGSISCRFCGIVLTDKNTAADAPCDSLAVVCNDEFCITARDSCCQKVLECGHYCNGVKDEKECLPCLNPECAQAAGSKQDGDDMCSVCYTDNLSAMPTVKLSCGHYFHYSCCRQQLEGRWNGARITFGFAKCSLCKQFIEHASLSDLVDPITELRKDVIHKALQRFKYEGLAKHSEVTTKGSRFYNDHEGFAMHKFAYYQCFKCKKPYFGGDYQCAAAAVDNDFDPSEMLCGACSPIQAKDCPKHGKDYLEFKCRFCCSVAIWFCFGTTHFCEPCHNNHSTLCNTDKAALVQCPCLPSGSNNMPVVIDGPCPLGVNHPPSGEEFALGCGLCRNPKTF